MRRGSARPFPQPLRAGDYQRRAALQVVPDTVRLPAVGPACYSVRWGVALSAAVHSTAYHRDTDRLAEAA